MTRITPLATLTALLFLAAAPARAQLDVPISQQPQFDELNPAKAVLAECGQPDLPEASIDSCLSRARALSDTNPSPDLDVLIAKLDQRSTTAFNPNGVDQGAPSSGAPKLAQSRSPDQPLAPDPDADAPPPNQLAPPDGSADAAPPAPEIDANRDVSDDDIPPMPDNAQMDDGPPPDVTDEDVPAPDDPPAADDDDPGPNPRS